MTGWATCRCVKPGIGVAACCSASVTSASWRRLKSSSQDINAVTQPQADIGSDLVVTRAAGVQALSGIADQAGQSVLDVEVYIFQIQRPGELTAFEFTKNLRHAAFDIGQILGADDLLSWPTCGHGPANREYPVARGAGRNRPKRYSV